MRKVKYITGAALALVLILMTLQTISGINSYAATTLYTSALEDLQSDSSFNFEAYPVNDNDNSLNVIQIAESTGGELFIYVYQPSARVRDLKASSINIARTADNSLELEFDNYPLTFLNSAGVFYKYKVENFELEKTVVRYYNISNILRPFEYMLDTMPGVGSISEVPYAVGQLWTVYEDTDGSVRYGMTASEIIEITQKYVGFLDLFDGINISGTTVNGTHTVRHFVAFSTDKPIDRLIQVELKYSLADCTSEVCGNILCSEHKYKEVYNRTRGEAIPQEPVTISADEKDSNIQLGGFLGNWAGNSYTWKKIQTTADFLAEESNKDYILTNTDGIKEITGTQWVLNFYKDVETGTGSILPWEGHLKWNYKSVTDVIILRLMFETDGETFNLGVVDSKNTGDNKPLNTYENDGLGVPWWVWVIVALGTVIIVLILICIFVPGAAPAIGRGLLLIGKGIIFGIYYLFYGVFWVISLPFRLIAKAIKNRKDKPKPSQSRKPAQKPKRKSKPKKAGKKK